MAITATFAADFTKWDAALKNATTNLKAFEVTTKNVGQQLNRAFSTFSGEKLIRDANLAVAAVTKLGGVTKLTAAEQTRLNATVTEALAKYKALGQTAPKEMQALADATKQVAAPTAAAAASVGSLVAKFVSVGAAIALAKQAFGALVDFLVSSVKSFAAAEAAQNRMVAALRAQGTATPAVIKQYAALASTIQRTTAFSDDAANEMQALFVQIGNVGPAQMAKATTAATDLAAGLGVDLRTATLLVAKAMEGNTGALGRYGIKITEAKVAAEGADAVFAAIQDRFGGQAVAQLDTYAGKLEQLANNWDNVQEAVGKFLVTNELTTLAMRTLAESMGTVSDESEQASISVGQFYRNITGDPFVGAAIALLEDYAAGLNAVAAGARLVAQVKSPFAGLATGLPKIVGGMEELDRQFDASKKAAEKAKATAEAAAKAYKTWAAAVTGLDKAMKAAALEKNLARLTAEGKLTATATQAIIKEYDELRPALDQLSDPLEALRTGYQKVLESTRVYAAAQAMVNTRTLPDAARMFEVGQTAVDQFGVRLKYLESTSIDLVVAMQAIPGVVKSTAVAADLGSRTLGQRIGSNLAENLEQALGNIPDIITDALIHGATFEQTAAAIGTQIGSAIGGAIGEGLGGFLGGKIGAAFGALLGPLLEAIIVTRAEKTQDRIREEYGVAISEGLAQAIEDAAARFGGDRQAAKLFNLDKIVAEGGGLSSSNIDTMLARLHDVFSAIETGAFTTEEAMNVLDKNFGEFAAFVTRDGALASAALLEIIELNERFGTSSKAVAEFVTSQVTSAIGGLTTFLENAEVTSQAAAEGIAASVFGAFEALTQQGATPLEAIKQITPVLEQLDAQLKAAGFSGGAAFDQLRAMAALASDAVKGPMIEAITGLGQALEGLHNSGVLNQEMFAGLSTQIADTYNKLIAQGTDGAQALALIGPSLQTIWELQQDFGYSVDAATQKLLDQAEAAGVVGDAHRSVQEQMLLATQGILEAVEGLAHAFGVTLPSDIAKTEAAAKAAAGGIAESFENTTPAVEDAFETWTGEAGKWRENTAEEAERLREQMERGCWGPIGEDSEAAWQDVRDQARRYLAEIPPAARKEFEKIPPIELEYDLQDFPKLPKPPTVKIPTKYERPDGSAVGFAEGGVVPGYAKGGVVYAQHGMWAPRGTDTVPAMLTPGEVVLPRDVVAALRSSASAPVTVNVTITAMDGADVERVVRSPGFRRALTSTVVGNDGGVRTDLRAGLGVR